MTEPKVVVDFKEGPPVNFFFIFRARNLVKGIVLATLVDFWRFRTKGKKWDVAYLRSFTERYLMKEEEVDECFEYLKSRGFIDYKKTENEEGDIIFLFRLDSDKILNVEGDEYMKRGIM